jgi:hypothetical protein
VNLASGAAGARRVLTWRGLRRSRSVGGNPSRRARTIWYMAALTVALLWTGCGGDVTPPNGRPSVAALRLVANAVPTGVSTLVVEVTAADIPTPLLFNIVATDGTASGTITVPAGSARTLVIRAYDAGAIETHRGSRTIDVQPTVNPSLAIALVPLQGQQPIDVRVESLVITVTAPSPSLSVGETIALQVAVTMADGTPVTVPPDEIRWATLNPSIATVSTTGAVLAVAAGQATVVAVYAGVGGSVSLVVVERWPILLAAGDVAKCGATFPHGNTGEATARIIDANPTATVAMLGDGAYENGALTEYTSCYHQSWGRFKDRTKPATGNHEYRTAGAAGYFDYFGAAAGTPGQGYYSYDMGAWHIVALNSEVSMGNTSAQTTWLRADLAANPKACTLIYYHHPRFSSGLEHGNQVRSEFVWSAAYQANVDVILGAHDHNYERFAKQTPAAVADPVRGIREFVVGTGGYDLQGMGPVIQPNSEKWIALQAGVLKLELRDTSYRWWFIAADGTSTGTVLDSGTTQCH